MRFARLLKRQLSARKKKAVSSHDRSFANNFVLESLEPRLLLSATPVPTTETATPPPPTAAIVTTDKVDYSPGETAVITTSNTTDAGAKFGDGEMVQFQVTRTDGVPDYPTGNEPWYVTDGVGGFEAYQEYDAAGQAVDRNNDGMADWIRPDNDLTVNGSISTTWFVEDQYAGASLQLTATGQTGGAVATTQFTDSGSFGYNTTAGFSNTVTLAAGATNSSTLSVDVDADKNNGSFNVSLTFATQGSTSIGIGSGANQINLTSVTRPFVTTPNPGGVGDSDTFPITVSVGTSVAPGTYHFKATAIESAGSISDGSGWAFDVIVSAPASTATTTTVTSNLNASTYGDSVTFTATVARTTGTGTPTGSVNFTIQGIGTVAGTAGPTTATTATWTYTTSALNAGSHTVSASFTGTGSFSNSNGALSGGQTVNQKTLTAAIIGDPTKPYDGNTNATLGVANFSLTGVLSGEGFTVTKTSGTYNSPNVATANLVSTTLAAGDFTAASGTLASNYVLPTTASGAGHITQKVFNYTIGNATKVFGQTINLATALGTSINTGVNGETLAITYSSDGVPNAALLGPYAINGTVGDGSGSLSNYDVTLIAGTLTVTAPSVITAVQSGGNLIIVGTQGMDTINVDATNPSAIKINGTGSWSVGPDGHVIVYGVGSADNINLTGNVNLEAHGGDGNDTITGGAGNDVIFGDAGDDTLTGSAGNDVVIGGTGSDRLVGSAGHDILIAGDLSGTHNGGAYDYDALRTISDGWASQFTTDGTDLGDGATDDVVDVSGDQLTGSAGHDWYIISTGDKITDINSMLKDGDKITNV